MQLANKKALAARTLNVGKGRITFVAAHLDEIKEAITRQDILDLHKAGAIQIKEISGRKTIVRRKNRRRTGKIKKKVKNTKAEYVILTRKFRTYSKYLLKTKQIDEELHHTIRNMIRARRFKSKRHLNEIVEEMKK